MTRSRKNVIRAGSGGQSVRRASRKAPEDPDVINDLTNDAGLIAARAAEPGRGRKAEGPNDFPLRGWLDIGWRVAHSISTDRILATSGSVAFFALLAVFPAVATLVSLYGLAADVHAVAEHLAVLRGILPASGLDLLGDQMFRIASQSSDKLGFAFVVGLLVALWSANSGILALFDALNIVYKEREKRSLLRIYLLSFVFTLGFIGFSLAAVTAVVVVPLTLTLVGLGAWSEQLIAAVRWPALLAIAALALSLLYRHGPSRRHAKWRWVSWGSAAAAISWIAMSIVFSWYVAAFDSYNRVYGSLGAVVGFMSWIWLSVVVFLIGGELNAAMELQTSVDSTDGKPRPLGHRHAKVADSVGESQSSS